MERLGPAQPIQEVLRWVGKKVPLALGLAGDIQSIPETVLGVGPEVQLLFSYL